MPHPGTDPSMLALQDLGSVLAETQLQEPGQFTAKASHPKTWSIWDQVDVSHLL